MSLTLGEKLRVAREERGISVSEVAEQTRISPHYLKSIENDDYKPLPGGIFNKGFIKSFAKYVGVDENEALQDYAQMVEEATEEENIEHFQSYKPEVLTDDRNAASMLPTIIIAGVILAVMTVGILFAVRYLQGSDSDQAAQATPAPAGVNSNTEQAQSQTAAPLPAMDKITVQLRAVDEEVWTRYTVDGTQRDQTLTPNESVELEANNSFKITYSKLKLPHLQITLNGKPLSPPVTESKKGTVEFEINKENLAQILQTGAISSVTAESMPESMPAAEPSPAPAYVQRQAEAQPSPVTARTSPAATNKAAPVRQARQPAKPPAVRPKPIASPTPIIVGRPRTAVTP